jgi:DNA-directed RNA polymerase subunit RPC12/RpoP
MRETVNFEETEGVCPYCGSIEVDYGAMDLLEDGLAYYPVSCPECGKSWEEYYELRYVVSRGEKA